MTEKVSGSTTTSINWNDRYQITSVETNGTLAKSYTYDALARRSSITDSSGNVTKMVYGSRFSLVADVDEDGNLIRTYTAGPGIDNWLSFTDCESLNTYYYITDHVGTVHAVTDSSGAVIESYRYSPFGKVLDVFDENGNTILKTKIGNRILFQGREYDWDTGFYYFRARWYDPDTGRWLSKDPIGINGGLNQYVFCGNNPVMLRDPEGLVVWGQVGRGFAGAGVSVIGMVTGVAATPTGALTGPGVALACVSAYSFGANVGNIINGFRNVSPAPTGPVGTVATLATDNRNVQTIADIADAVIPLVIAGRIEWSRLPTQSCGLPGTLAGTLQRVPMNPSVAYPALRAYEYGYLGLQGYDYLIDPALDALNNRCNDNPNSKGDK